MKQNPIDVTISDWNEMNQVPGERYGSASGSLGLVIFKLDKSGHVSFVEGNMLNQLHFEPAAIIGRDIREIHANNPGALAAIDKALRSEGGRYMLRSGGMALDSMLKPVCDSEGNPDGAIGFAVDVTKTVEMMEKYTTLQSQFSDMAGLVNEVIWKTDLDGRFTYVSNASAKLYGYAPEEIIGTKFRSDFSTDEKSPECQSFWHTTFRSGKILERFENEIKKKNGDFCYVLTSGKPSFDVKGRLTGYFGIDLDVTERKLTEKWLLKGERKFEEIQHIAQVGSWELNYRTNIFIGSAEAYRIFEIPYASVVSLRDFFNAVHPAERERIKSLFSRAVMNGYSFDEECRVVLGNKIVKYLRVIASTKYDAATGLPVSSLGTVQDITESKRIQLELIKAQKEAEKANRAKSAFLANVSHEIRTPMNGIIGFLDLIQQTELSQEQRNLLKGATTASEALLNLIGDILDLSKIEAGKLTVENRAFQFRLLLEDCLRIFAPLASEKGLRLKASVSEDMPDDFIGDPARLMQIISNLLSNAVKFTGSGDITVKVKADNADDGYSAVHVVVSDSGIGMSEEIRKCLFTPFMQGDSSATRKYGGTGLGLAITKKLVEMMGGHISCESRPGEGSSFSFTVRLQNRHAGVPAPDHTGSGPETGRRAGSRATHVLVVDDNTVNRMLITKMLESKNIRCSAVKNGIEAVGATEKTSYDVILMDCQMPEMDGLEATAKIRELPGEKSRVPIIALTANAINDEREKCIAAGMDDYISKPVRMDILLSKIKKYADRQAVV